MNRLPSKATPSVPASYPSYEFRPLRLFITTLWQFSRPHTIIGTSLSVLALFTIAQAIQQNKTSTLLTPLLITILLPALLACLAGNVYIVGLNQLEDVAIDRINKPHLPLAAGDWSYQQGRWVVAVMGISAIGLACFQGPFLLAVVSLSLLIGTAYSLPPIRLKRFPLWASLCILSVRGVIINLGLFLHFHQQWLIPAPIWALTLFILIFTIAIALFKDVPDMDGDRRYRISTFTLRLGPQRVFDITRYTLIVCYGGMILAGLAGLPMVNRPILIGSHGIVLVLLWIASQKVNLSDKSSITRFYQTIWKLFFSEYLIFPIACWFA
jgi:homogentisate phytyltransferase/homogentisate geranylgeranyltransferase